MHVFRIFFFFLLFWNSLSVAIADVRWCPIATQTFSKSTSSSYCVAEPKFVEPASRTVSCTITVHIAIFPYFMGTIQHIVCWLWKCAMPVSLFFCSIQKFFSKGSKNLIHLFGFFSFQFINSYQWADSSVNIVITPFGALYQPPRNNPSA